MNEPDAITLIRSTGNITTTPPANTGLVDNFKVACLPDDYFKKNFKGDACIFTNFKEGKYWDAWKRNDLATTRAQDTVKVLDSDYRAETNDESSLFKEKQTFMHAVFDKTLQTD